MTKTNSLKKALAGILAACMAATTLVAAPFTFGGSQSVGAVGLDEMELLAQYSFESGYTDSVSGEAGTLDETAEGTVTLQKEDDNTYMSVGSSGNYNNVLAVANPYAGDTASAMTIAMKVRVNESNDYQGLWAFIQDTAGSWAGLCGTGGFHYNYTNGYADYTTGYNGTIPVDAQWHEVVTTITENGDLTLYVDGQSKYTISEPAMIDGFYQFDTLLIGAGCSEVFAWGSSTADYDDVRLYSGAADAEAVASIYQDTATPVANWTFEEGNDELTTTGTVTFAEDEVQGNVATTTYGLAAERSFIQFDNPLKDSEGLTGVTVSMNVKFAEGATVNAYEGHWGFMNGATDQDGFFGIGGDASPHYNECWDVGDAVNNYFDTTLGLLSADGDWHKVAVTVTNDGLAKVYVDGSLVSTVDTVATMQATDPSNAATTPTATATSVLDFITSSNYFNLGFASGFWGSAGASYDNVAIYDSALSDVEIANLPGTIPSATEEPEEPEEPVDPGEPIPISRDAIGMADGTYTESQWQVIDGDESQTSKVSVESQAVGSNYSVYGWFKLNTATSPKGWMNLYQQTSVGNDWAGSRMWVESDGQIGLRVENSGFVDTYVEGFSINPDEPFFLTVNYDGANKVVDVYINGQLVASQSGHAVAASSLPVSAVWLGVSPLPQSDAILDGSVAGFYYWNSLFDPTTIETYMQENPAPTSDLPKLDYATADIENLNIVEGGENVTYGETVDENGNKEILSVDGNAKAMLSTEKYTQETLAATADDRYAGTPGYRAFDVDAFLADASDFAITSWVRWYGDGSTAWGGTQALQAQRFFDLFNIDDADQSKYEFYFNGWEENYYQRNPSVSSASELQEGIDELQRLNNNPNQSSAEAGVYLCGISVGATMNGLDRPCFRPGLTFVANGNQTNSGLPYQWTHIAVVYDADGHLDDNGRPCGASLTYYVDGAAYAVRYFDYADADLAETVDAFYQNNSDPKNATFIEGKYDPTEHDASYNNQVVGGSLDGADVIYGLTSAEQLEVKHMALDTLYLGASTDSTALWNGQYQNAYLYNYAITSTQISEDFSQFVEPVEGTSANRPASEAENPFQLAEGVNAYSLVTEEDEFSKTMETGFNTQWYNNSSFRDSDSLALNGEGGYVSVPVDYLKKADGTVTDQLTFSTWVSVNESVNWGRIFDIKGSNGELFLSNNGWFNNDADVGMGLRSSTLDASGKEASHTDTSVGQYIPTSNWVNITVVIDGLNVSIYYQGNLLVSGELEMTLSQMNIDTFYLGRSAAVDGKYGLPLDADNNITLDETYLFQTALTAEQISGLTLEGYTGLSGSTTSEDSSRLDMIDVADLFDAELNVDVYYVDITDHKTLSADVMNALAGSTGKTLYVRVQQGVSYDFVWKLTSEAFAGRSYTSADEFDLLVSGDNMSDADATTILTKWSQIDPTASVTLRAQTITVYAERLPVSLPLFINYGRDFLGTDGTTLTDATLNLYKGTASDYTLVTAGLQAATGADGNALMQDYTNPSTSASGTVVEYYVQDLTEGGSYILTTNTLP